jgi:hypothetical protein
MLADTHDQPLAGKNAAPLSFTRYLAAKKSVDDRALNQQVWDALRRSMPRSSPDNPLHILEVGAGIGTMVERALEWDLARYACYTALDSSAENLDMAGERLKTWAQRRGLQTQCSGRGLTLHGDGLQVQVAFEQEDLQVFTARQRDAGCWDLLIAHHFMDLMHLPATLPGLFGLLSPHGLFLASLNFDGVSILEPVIDPSLDEQVMALYHQTMDERRVDGRPSGNSRTGRRMFGHIRAAGGEVLNAGASDWVVFAGTQGYPGDEAYFLRYIIYTIQRALAGRPELDSEAFAAWIRERLAQIDRGELVYIAHQLDFFGRLASRATG